MPKVNSGVTLAFPKWQIAPELTNGRNGLDNSTCYITGMTDDNSIMNLITGVPGKKPMTRDQIVDEVISGDFKPPRSRLYNSRREKVLRCRVKVPMEQDR
jgi:hypothetical protein